MKTFRMFDRRRMRPNESWPAYVKRVEEMRRKEAGLRPLPPVAKPKRDMPLWVGLLLSIPLQILFVCSLPFVYILVLLGVKFKDFPFDSSDPFNNRKG